MIELSSYAFTCENTPNFFISYAYCCGKPRTKLFEAIGRMINPGAYKKNDAKLAGQKHKEAMVNSLEGFQKQGMAPDAQARMMKQMGGNLKDVQNDLNYRNKPKPNLTRRQEDIGHGCSHRSLNCVFSSEACSRTRRTSDPFLFWAHASNHDQNL